jgi:uncharacterized membrane protein
MPSDVTDSRRPLQLSAPLHPLLVHFTVALTVSAYGFDLLALLTGTPSLRAIGWWDLAAAIVLTVGTVATGVRSRLRLPMEEGAARAMLRAHMAVGPMVLGLLIAVGVWRAGLWRLGTGPTWTYMIAMSVAVLAVAAQGYLGGELVYRYGAEVRSGYRRLPLAHGPCAAAIHDRSPRKSP